MIVLISVTAIAAISNAACVVRGTIDRIQGPVPTMPVGTKAAPIIYFSTADNQLVSMLTSAQTSSEIVTLTGDASACPQTGATRFGGTLTNVDIARNH